MKLIKQGAVHVFFCRSKFYRRRGPYCRESRTHNDAQTQES